MVTLVVDDFLKKYFNQWDKFVDESSGGTLFHKSSFLLYHGISFVEQLQIVALVNDNRIEAGIIFKKLENKCISPAGSSFGGILIRKNTGLEKAKNYSEQILAHLKDNYGEITITFAPICYNKNGEYLNWLMTANDFSISTADLFNVLDTASAAGGLLKSVKSKVRSQTKKALTEFDIIERSLDYKTFYKILLQDKARLGAIPTHTENDIKYLIETFHPNAFIDFALHKETGAKCAIFYLQPTSEVLMTFYISQEDLAKGLNGINALITVGADRSFKAGIKYYDMGSSTFGYNIQNIGLASFKENFSTMAFLRSCYKWEKNHD